MGRCLRNSTCRAVEFFGILCFWLAALVKKMILKNHLGTGCNFIFIGIDDLSC